MSSVAGWRETFGRDLEAKAKLRRRIGKGIERGNRLVPQHFMLAANGSYPGTPLEALLSSLMNIFIIYPFDSVIRVGILRMRLKRTL